MQKKGTSLFLFFIFVMCFISCRKESLHSLWEVEVFAPIVKSTLTINNIVPDSLLYKNSDNSVDIVYTTDLYSFSVVTIPDTTIDTIYKSPITFPFAPGTFFVPPVDQKQKFSIPNGVQLKKAIIRSGKLVVLARNYVEEMIRVRYQIPSAQRNGVKFDTTFDVPAQTGGGCPGIPTVFTSSHDMSGYVFDFTGTSGNEFNMIVTNISAQINPLAAKSVTVTPCDSIYISNGFVDMLPQYANGYFGKTLIHIVDTSDFMLFNHIINGTLSMEAIDINFSVENSMGIDARITIDDIYSINTRTGNIISLQHPIITSPLNINRAVDNNGNITSSTYSVSFNPSNSNIGQFIENRPDKIGYNLDIESNPLGNVSGSNDFYYYEKLLKTEMNMTIPLSVIANDLTMADTLDFNMNANADNIHSGTLYLYAENGFPFTAETQLYLMDVNLKIVDSLVSVPNIILAPPLDANFICAGKQLTKLTIPIDESKMRILKSIKKIYITMKFNTTGQPEYVKIYSFYEMNIRLVGDFNYVVGKE